MIHGDSSGHRIGIRLYDAGGEKYVKPLGTVDWTGWKRFDIPTDLANWNHYQGDENNVFNLPVSQFNLELTAVTTGPKTGALFVDDVTLEYESGPVVAADFEKVSISGIHITEVRVLKRASYEIALHPTRRPP